MKRKVSAAEALAMASMRKRHKPSAEEVDASITRWLDCESSDSDRVRLVELLAFCEQKKSDCSEDR